MSQIKPVRVLVPSGALGLNYDPVALERAGAVNAVMICDTLNQQAVFDAFVESMARERIFTPPLLGVSRAKPTLAE